jgi:hypothetical protein
VPADSIRHLFLDGVVPLILSVEGPVVLHASAVLTPYGACGFLAETGTGKSTLAASFQKEACPLVSDDCLVVAKNEGVFCARTSYPGARLRADSLSHLQADPAATLSVAHYNSKRRLKSVTFANQNHPLAAIYCVQRNREGGQIRVASIEALSGHNRLVSVLRYMYCLDPHDPGTLVRQFKLLESLVSVVPVLNLEIPNGYQHLPDVRSLVLSDMREREAAPSSGVATFSS